MTAEEPYVVRQSGDVVELEDRASATVVSIVPAVGNIAFSMKVHGQDVLHWPYASLDAFKADPGMSGIPFLGPWANRLDEDAFYANGTRYGFDMSIGNVRGPLPIHGFLTTTDEWQVVDALADGTSAWVTSRLDFYKNPLWMKQWPFAHTVEMTHRLRDGVLQVQTAITNRASEAMPVSVGFHPYFQLTDSPRNDWTMSVPARTRWLLADTKVPTGETAPADTLFPGGRSGPLRDYDLDDVLSDLVRDSDGRAHVVLTAARQRLDIALGPNWRALVIWSPNNEDSSFICIEPMAAISNALNLAHAGKYDELQSIQPGGTWQESFWIHPTGFEPPHAKESL